MKALNNRGKEITTLLYESNKVQTSEDLSTLLNVSTRTVRSDIKNANEALNEHGANITSIKSKGYLFEVYDLSKFELFKLENFIDKDNFLGSIIKELLLHSYKNHPLFQQDLADKLFISLSSLKKNLPWAVEKMEKYNLGLIANNVEGILLDGNEEDMRHAIKNSFFDDDNNYPKEDYQQLLSLDLLDKIDQEIYNLSSKHVIKLTDDARRNLGMDILIAISRSKVNKYVIYSGQEVEKIERTEEYSMALSLQKNLRITLGDALNEEIHYIAKKIIVSGKLDSFDICYSEVDVEWIIDNILKSIKKRTSIDFQKDTDLKTGLSIHLNVAFNRIQFKTQVQNDSLNTIKSDYPVAFELAIIASKEIKKLLKLELGESEIGYIAIHFGVALEKFNYLNNKKIKKIIVLCGSGIATSTLIREKIKSHLNDYITDIQTISLGDFDAALIKQTDLILTTIPLQIQSSKIMRINTVLSNIELSNIRKYFEESNSKDKKNIREFFDKKLFLKNVEKPTKDEALNYITDLMIEHGYIDSVTKESIFDRENIASTELGRLIAIPHPLDNKTKVPIISICILEKPITWDKQKVQVILVFSMPHKDIELWEIVFKKIYTFLYEELGINKLINEFEYEDFIYSLEQGKRRV
ncbi:BglG family transcription antiterminator [Salinicoccus hispanicus]|uniref:PRD domain-containing protein n=1 Tax=Salinicoccus hispanicus TaxID=157225 RepID=A0A6N8U5Q3_9STAP|nr:BglG family transcription antiterminator [Salinicoccus hispanicus]MXQ51631.1 PRD domain-containing protein [Salinicoccus hispanicus]